MLSYFLGQLGPRIQQQLKSEINYYRFNCISSVKCLNKSNMLMDLVWIDIFKVKILTLNVKMGRLKLETMTTEKVSK